MNKRILQSIAGFILVILIFYGFFFVSHTSIGSWSQGANVLDGRYNGCGASYVRNDSGIFFFMGGFQNGTVLNYNDKYNLQTNTWTRMASLPSNLWYSSAASLKDSVYIAGGMTTASINSQVSTLLKYDINSNTWSTRANLPSPTAWNKLAGYQDSLIYSLGGFASQSINAVNNVYLYNSPNNTWRMCTPMPAALCGQGAAISGDTIVIWCGGSGLNLGLSNAVYRGVISQNDRSFIFWSGGTSYPGISRQPIDGAPWSCKGIISGPGSPSGFNTTNECYTYSPGNNLWSQQQNVPIPTGAVQCGSFRFANGITKFICASGYTTNPPNAILNTQIFTDTLCVIPPPSDLCEQFSSQTFPPTDWTLIYSGSLYWQRAGESSYGLGFGSAKYDMWNAPSGTDQSLISPVFNPVTPGSELIFDIAYTTYPSTPPYSQDSLVILASTNGGTTYPFSIIRLGPEEMLTAQYEDDFAPSPDEWLKKQYTLPAGTNRLQFLGKSDYGNNLYIDTICLERVPIGITGNHNSIPSAYHLFQNYPNPFNPTTKIKFDISANSPLQFIGEGLGVRLSVYNILGQKVAILINENLKPGSYEVEWNASDFPSGVYFYRIVSGEFVDVKKMLLVK